METENSDMDPGEEGAINILYLNRRDLTCKEVKCVLQEDTVTVEM